MEDLHLLFKPTGAYLSGMVSDVMSYCSPCGLLSPYISSYWGTVRPTTEYSIHDFEPSLIIPDACVDIIFTIDHTNGIVHSGFCGISDQPSHAWSIKERSNMSRFAIQFYCWGAQYFISDGLKNSYNSYLNVETFFTGWGNFFVEMLLNVVNFQERVKLTELFLKEKFRQNHYNQNMMNALSYILHSKGTSSVKGTCNYTVISQRQMERVFQDYLGMSIKKINDLVRYQNLWQDIAYSKIQTIHDAVDKYHYVDQAHLINDFKKFHTMTPREALKAAWK